MPTSRTDINRPCLSSGDGGGAEVTVRFFDEKKHERKKNNKINFSDS